nr:reverse transcriptase domain-containing protein [Tanacetum cinerariifolium]
MSTRSSTRNLFSPLDNPELTIRRRSHADPTLLNDFEMAAEGNGDLLVPDLRTMKELCQPSLNGRGGLISPIAILATNFRLKNDMIQQVQNTFQFHGLSDDDANKHIDKFLHVTQSIKVNGVTDDALRLYLFPHSLTHHATAWFDRGTFMKRHPKECYNLIENMTAHHNDWDTSAQRSESSSSITSSFDTEIAALKAKMAEINNNIIRVLQVNQQVKAVTPNSETCGGPHSFSDCPITVGQTQNVYAAGSYQSNSYQPQVVERETEATKDMVHPTNKGSTKDIQPSVIQIESPVLNFKPVVAPITEPVAAPVSAPKPNQRPSIPYPSRLQDQKLCDKANDQREKIFQIFKDLNFNISFADALILMPKFGPTIKTLLTNKGKLSELARTLLNKHCSVVLLKNLPEKPGDPGKFLIPCDFPGMAECLALADLGASINLMPLSVWNKLSLLDFSPTCMTLELADRSISLPIGVAEDVFVKIRRTMIDVFEGELTLRVSKEAITFNLDQTSRYSANYNDMTENLIEVIDVDCEVYSQEVLEVDAFLALEDDPTSPKVDHSYVDTEGDILLLEAFLNDDPSLPLPNQGNYLPQVRKQLKICKAKTNKFSIDEPPEVELKTYLPISNMHFWKHDFEPAVQHQRRVNPKIHDVIKNEVLKLLDAGLIYPISNSPWVSPVHYVLKKGSFTIVENEENELIPTCMVMGWRVCIDYQKLNDATSKDHFPLLFMDQMLERLAGNEYYCFLDGFSDFSKIARPITRLLKKDTQFFFSKECVKAFQTLKRKLTEAPLLIAPDWDFPFELMYDASDFAIGVVLGNKSIVYRDHSSLKCLFAKKDSKVRLLRWVLLLQEFTFKVIDIKGAENLAADHLSRIETPHQNVLDPNEINESFPLETLNMVSFRSNSIDENRASWSDKLDDALWAFQTAYKIPIGCTPYKLVYGKACHLLIELEHKAYWALKHANFDLQTAGDHRKVQLNELNELRDQAYENSLIYKEKTKRLHDSKIKDRLFNIDDRVLLFISRLKIFSGKLKSRWSGPFTISYIFPYGTVELSQPDGPNFKVNGHRLKHYFGEDIPKIVVLDL